MSRRPAIELADIMRAFAKEYFDSHGERIPGMHRKAIHDIMACRTPEMGGTTYYCPNCRHYQYSYHSCGNRNCNKCQSERADEWLEKAGGLLLPVPHFMVTFTLPKELRPLARSNQRLFYNLVLKASAESLQKLAYDARHIGGLLGLLSVLHTWGRNLTYHPHVHVIATGGGLLDVENIWLPSRHRFLVPVEALSIIFAAKFRDALRNAAPDLFRTIDKRLWRRKWVVDSKPIGDGVHALKYLAQYIFRPAISNSRILRLDGDKLTFTYQHSETKQWCTPRLHAIEFIRRYLQHVLPKGFVKVRYYGLYAHRNRHLLARIRQKISTENKQTDEPRPAEEAPKTKTPKTPTCPCCREPLLVIAETRRGGAWPTAPPAYDSRPARHPIQTIKSK